jgi:peptidoglycan/LPS O-acetylase OafA/YrhL
MTAKIRNPVIDFLKGAAIVAVILLHSFRSEQLRAVWAWFYIWQAVPVLAVLLGVAASHTRFSPLRDYYVRRAQRLLPAFAVAWGITFALGHSYGSLIWDWTLLLGRLPFAVPGSYFVTLLFEWVLIAPFLVWGYRRFPKTTLAAAFLLSVAFEVFSWATGMVGYGYSGNILRFIFAAALGLWVADGRAVAPIALLGVVVILAYALGWSVPVFDPHWQPQGALSAGYAALIVALAMRYVTRPPVVLVEVGRASYHVFLVQALWFGYLARAFPQSQGLAAQIALACGATVVVSLLGVLWYRLEWRVLRFPARSAARPDDI